MEGTGLRGREGRRLPTLLFLLFLVSKNIVSYKHKTLGEVFAKGRKARRRKLSYLLSGFGERAV